MDRSQSIGVCDRDGYPCRPGTRWWCRDACITDWWEATPGERADIFDLVDIVRDKIAELHGPDGFNVGFNAGPRQDRRSTTCTFT